MTLLEKFIRQKERTLSEPPRQGVPKGEKIGGSMKRTRAALLMLTGSTQTEIARLLNTKQPAIARWLAEPGFAEDVAAYVEEFADTVMAFLKKKHAKLQNKNGTLLLPEELWEPYSADVRDAIGQRIRETYGRESLLGWELIMKLATEDFKLRMLHDQSQHAASTAMKLLQKPRLTTEDKKVIEVALKLSKLYILMLEKKED